MSGLFDVPLLEHEPFMSWFARLARANSAPNSRVFGRYIGADPKALMRGNADEIAVVANLVGRPAEELQSRAILMDAGGNLIFGGSTYGTRLVLRTRLRFCPHCVQSDDENLSLMPGARRHFRLHWMFPSVQTCPVHRRQIVETHHVGLQRHSYDHISQLEVVGDSMPELVEASVPRQITAFERYVCDRLEGRRCHGDFLDRLTLATGIIACELLGVASIHGPRVSHASLPSEDMVKARDTAFQILRKGENGFAEILDTVRSEARGAVAGGQAMYGNLYMALSVGYRDPEHDILREMIRSHTLERVRMIGACELFGRVEASEWRTISALCEATGKNQQTICRLLVELGYESQIHKAGRGKVVHVSIYEDFLEKLGDLIELEEVASILGIKRMHAWYLLKGGFIQPVVKRDNSSDRGYRILNRYSKKEMFGLLNRLTQSAIAPCPSDWVPIAKAVKLANTSYVDLLKSVAEGRIGRYGSAEGVGISALRFDPAEIETLYWKPPVSALDRDEVRKRTLLTSKAFTYLVSNGFLPAERVQLRATHMPVWMVAKDALEDFNSRYVTFALIAKETGCSTRTLGRNRQDNEVPLAFPAELVKQQIVERRHLGLVLNA